MPKVNIFVSHSSKQKELDVTSDLIFDVTDKIVALEEAIAFDECSDVDNEPIDLCHFQVKESEVFYTGEYDHGLPFANSDSFSTQHELEHFVEQEKTFIWRRLINFFKKKKKTTANEKFVSEEKLINRQLYSDLIAEMVREIRKDMPPVEVRLYYAELLRIKKKLEKIARLLIKQIHLGIENINLRDVFRKKIRYIFKRLDSEHSLVFNY